ncbi:MAG: hypothetical protein QOD93_7156 [Acetobacteraceae bacterium]|jgi:hypothetical protein|nr:hypothetical protein [Acetobacteraceae bacterium]
MQAYARLERVQGASRRGSSRLKLSLDASLAGSGEEVVIHDLSPGGILVETSASLRKGARLEVELPEVGATQAKVVWSSGDYYGCQFDKPIPKAVLSAALLRNPFEALVAPPVEEISDQEAAEFVDDRAPFAIRMRVILGSAVLLWALILWAVGVI